MTGRGDALTLLIGIGVGYILFTDAGKQAANRAAEMCRDRISCTLREKNKNTEKEEENGE